MLLEKLNNYIKECDLHDKVWSGVLAAGLELEDILSMNEDEINEVYDYLNEETKQQIEKLKEGGLI
jgi:hypothetical protein